MMDKLVIGAMLLVTLYAVGACDRPPEQPSAFSPARPAAQTPSNRPSEPSVTTQVAELTFDAIDADGDGVITLDEARAVPGLDFASADTDGSSTLSRREFAAAISARRPAL